MEARLVVVGGKANKSEVKLKLPSMIGRSRDADVTVSHASVSRHHCLIYELEGALVVRDNGSLNGTVVEGEKIQESLLKPGQSLTIGPLTFRAEYEHDGSFPLVGPAPAEANGQAHRGGLSPNDEVAATLAALAAPPSDADEETVQAEAEVAESEAAESEAAESEAAESEAAESEAAESEVAESEVAESEVADPSVDEAAPPSDAGEETAQAESEVAESEAAEAALPDVHFDSEAAATDEEEVEAGVGGFDFLTEESAESAETSSKPSFGFLGGGGDSEPAAVEESGAIFNFADESPKPTTTKEKPKEKSPVAANKEAASSKSPAGNGSDEPSEDAALNDFLNSLGLEE